MIGNWENIETNIYQLENLLQAQMMKPILGHMTQDVLKRNGFKVWGALLGVKVVGGRKQWW